MVAVTFDIPCNFSDPNIVVPQVMLPFFGIPFVASGRSGMHSYRHVNDPDEETLLTSLERKRCRFSTSFSTTVFFDPSFWLTTFAILSIAINIRSLLIFSHELHATYLEVSVGSPYNGLEKFVRNESSPSWPLSSTHYPDFIGVTGENGVRHLVNNGSIVRLDPEHTIVIQHRVRDYGLEHCAVKLEFSQSPGNGHEHRHTARTYGYIGEGAYLALWRLEDSGSKAVALASDALPALLPSRKEFIGNITLDGTRLVRSPFFRCDAGSIQTLEIAVVCVTSPCIMEFRLTRWPQRQGFWVIQSEQGPLV